MKLTDFGELLSGVEDLLIESQRTSGHPGGLSVGEYRASMLQGCLRQQYYRMLYPQQFDLKTKGKFKIGQNLHAEVQGWLKELLKDRLVCEQLWTKDINNKIRLTGHTDGVIDNKFVVEIKSIRSVDFVRSGPKAYHVSQLQNYFWLTGLEEGVILYVDKVNYLMKQFPVLRDEKIIDKNLNWFVGLHKFLVVGKLPPCTPLYKWECDNCMYTQCEKCNTKK